MQPEKVTRIWTPESKEDKSIKMECLKMACGAQPATEGALLVAQKFYEWAIKSEK